MSEQHASDLARRGLPPKKDEASLASDLVWGVQAIAREIGRNPRQTFHLLENGKLPAGKVGGRWCASRAGLRQFFAGILAREVEEARQ